MKRSPSLLRILSLATLFLAGSIALHAQGTLGNADVPRTISYQGLLTSSDGAPFADGQYEVTVTIYADAHGSQTLWQETYLTDVRSGVFNLYLGSENRPLPTSDKLNSPLWIGTSVNGADEMSPLTPLTASPYALNVPDKAITGSKLADKAVTAEKVDMNYVAGVEVNGEEIMSNGALLKIQSGTDIDVRYDETTSSLVIESKSAAGAKDNAKGGPTTLDDNSGIATNWRGRNPPQFPIGVNPLITGGTYNSVGGGNGTVINDGNYNGIFGGDVSVINDNSDYNFIGGGQANAIGDAAGTSSDWNTVSGGFMNSSVGGDYNTIGGGRNNVVSTAMSPATESVIGGGSDNQVLAPMATIGGGNGNIITTPGAEATIAGGHLNRVESYVAAITGGHDNVVMTASEASFIGGGRNNVHAAERGVIGGGFTNSIQSGSVEGFIGGGNSNQITDDSPLSVIGGGGGNTISATEATIGGGSGNTITSGGNDAFIGGGGSNTVEAQYAALAGGQNNRIIAGSDWAFIGAGMDNQIFGNLATIGGGGNNTISAPEATIAGGHVNTVESYAGGVLGGHDNIVGLAADFGAIGGGQNNRISNGLHSTISGGMMNTIDAPMATVGGGADNNILIGGAEGTIAGGHINTLSSYVAAIGGGHNNVVSNNSPYSVIGGGQANNVTGTHTTIAGGDNNLTDPSYAQTIVGFFNAQRGAAVAARPPVGTIRVTDLPLFIVGNGDGSLAVPNRSNAFEVSYNGHATVFDNNGSGAANAADRGARYEDNTMYAWACVDADAGVVDDFGVSGVAYGGPGTYFVTVNYNDQYGIGNGTLNLCPVATLRDGYCGFISVQCTQQANTFMVTTMSPDCGQEDMPFTIHVMGRPQ